jgi:outer membrane protein
MKRHSITRIRSIVALATIIAAVACMAPAGASAQSAVKVGIVNFDEIISKLPEFKQVEGELQSIQQRYMDTLRALQTNLEAMANAYQKQQALLNQEAKAAEEQKIVASRDELLRYQQDRLGQGGAFAQTQARLLQPIREKVRGAIERVAKSEKITLVLEANATVYFDDKTDITFKVLDNLKRGTN